MRFSFIPVRRECVHMEYTPKTIIYTNRNQLCLFIYPFWAQNRSVLTVTHERDTGMLHRVFILSSFMDFIASQWPLPQEARHVITFHLKSTSPLNILARVIYCIIHVMITVTPKFWMSLNQFKKLLLLPLTSTIRSSKNEVIQQYSFWWLIQAPTH